MASKFRIFFLFLLSVLWSAEDATASSRAALYVSFSCSDEGNVFRTNFLGNLTVKEGSFSHTFEDWDRMMGRHAYQVRATENKVILKSQGETIVLGKADLSSENAQRLCEAARPDRTSRRFTAYAKIRLDENIHFSLSRGPGRCTRSVRDGLYNTRYWYHVPYVSLTLRDEQAEIPLEFTYPPQQSSTRIGCEISRRKY